MTTTSTHKPILCERCDGYGLFKLYPESNGSRCEDCNGEGTVPLPTLAEALGISYRQLDYWINRGYLHAGQEHKGSGNQRWMDEHELNIASYMVRLVEAGLTVDAAAVVARRFVFDGSTQTTLPGGVIITMEVEGGSAESLQKEEA